MEFTSGGTGKGEEFDYDACDLDGNNVYGSLLSLRSARAAAEGFDGLGWRVRRSSWTEYEVETRWALLELHCATHVHFAGVAAPERIAELRTVLGTISADYRLEHYDENGGEIAVHAGSAESRGPSGSQPD